MFVSVLHTGRKEEAGSCGGKRKPILEAFGSFAGCFSTRPVVVGRVLNFVA